MNAALRHAGSLLQGLLDAVYRRIDIDYRAALESTAIVRAHPHHAQHLRLGIEFGYDNLHFEGADIQTDDEIFMLFCHGDIDLIASVPPCANAG